MLEVCCDLGRGLFEEAAQDPHNLQNCSQIDKPQIRYAELPLEDVIRLASLPWVVLEQISQDDIGIEPDHRR
jgi:hypothetical protein